MVWAVPGCPNVAAETVRAGSPAETYGELMIDRGSLIVRRAGQDVLLPPTELRLLLVLSGSPRQVFSREQLLALDRQPGGSTTALAWRIDTP
jgi:DNA-binding response OmpR family regulator